jgi:hypothetical protein
MSYYAKLRAVLETADNATYANEDAHKIEADYTYGEGLVGYRVNATAAGETISLVPFGTFKALLIENLGTTASTYVTVGHKNAAAATVAVKVPIAAEGFHFYFTPDLSNAGAANLTLTASAGTIACRISVLAS